MERLLRISMLLLFLSFSCFIKANAAGHTVSITSTNVNCYATCTGTAAATVNGGTGPFGYSWMPGNLTGSSVNSLCAGTYTCTVTDSSDMSTASASITITQPPVFTASITSFTNVSCNGGNNGSATVSFSGGTPPYSIMWNTNPVQTTATAVYLVAGTYTVTVTDANACTATATVTITQPAPVVVTLTPTNPTCNNPCNGAINVTSSPSAVTYAWSPNFTATGPYASNLCPGTFTCTVTTANGCTGVNYVLLSLSSPQMTVTTSVSPATCGNNNGSATVTNVTGGVSPYSYLWSSSPQQSTQTASSLASGNYVVTVTDNTGCQKNQGVVVPNVNGPSVSVTSSNPSCYNGNNGTATATASGGTPPYTYNWYPAGSTNATVTGLSAGSYTVTATDANNCIGSQTVILTQPTQLVTSVTSTNACNACNGSATAIASGGTPPYTYSWPAVNATTPTVNNLCPSFYTVTVTDANNCITTNGATIAMNNLSMSVSTTPSACNQSTGAASVTVTGGTAPYTYLWNTSQTTSSISNMPPGLYDVIIHDSGNCIDTAYAGLNSTTPPTVTITSLNNVTCNSAGNGWVTVNASGGTPPYYYSWNTIPQQTASTASSLSAGTWYSTVTDNSGCVTVTPVTITQPPTLFVAAYTSNANCSNNGYITTYVQGGVPPYSFSWNTSPVQTTSMISNLAPGPYVLTVTDNMGCIRTNTITVGSSCYSLIKGRVFDDLNSNCVQDPSENGLAGRLISAAPGGHYATTNTNGDYLIGVNPGTYTVTMQSYLYWNQVCPASAYTAVLTTPGDSSVNNDFAAAEIPNMQDLRVSLVQGVSRPGFLVYSSIMYSNVGTMPMSGTIQLTHDPVLTYVSSLPAASSYNNPVIQWNFANLQPGQSGWINYTMQVPSIQNGGYLGRELDNFVVVMPVAGDQVPADNIDTAVTFIQGSYDPNLKEVVPQGTGPAGLITSSDSVLKYTIHFQNTGTDTAFTIVVEDTLSPFLDPVTLQSGASSHPYTFELTGPGVARWRFNNILLVDSTTNEPASHGFVKFTIKQRSNNTASSVISNKADIYFDFNLPVTTNTVINTLDDPLYVEAAAKNDNISVYPNPFSDGVTITVNGGNAAGELTLEVYNILGTKVRSMSSLNGKFVMKKDDLAPGIYLYRISSAQETISSGKMTAK